MIEVRGVTKRFGTTVALDDVSFQLTQGEILGFLGPNGAGKSTAMKIITTFLAPDSGSVTVEGINVMEDPLAVRGKIGYMPENVPLYLDMNVHEYLAFVGRARGLTGGRLEERLHWCVEACGLQSEFKKQIQELSKGFRQRTGLAQALIHDPQILILDEPTSGLDPLQILEIRDLIHSLAGKKTIIFSTHILQEVSPVTDRVVVINEGQIIADGLIDELARAAMGENRVLVGIKHDAAEAESALRQNGDFGRITRLATETGGLALFEIRGPFDRDITGAVAELAIKEGWKLRRLHESRFTLEDTFLALTRQSQGSHKGVA